MLNLVSASLVSLLLSFGQSPPEVVPAQMLSWQDASLFQLPVQPDPDAIAIAQQYLEDLVKDGIAPETQQGIWLQSGMTTLAEHHGKVPRSAASLTKIATTLAALGKWDASHQFTTSISINGTIENGVLQGDLIIIGEGDPLFVWEEAITLGNTLSDLGIKRVTGDLIVVGDFFMNFNSSPTASGSLFKQALNQKTWSGDFNYTHGNMSPGTPRPEIEIAGVVKKLTDFAPETILIEHNSLTLAEILKYMNIYSHNALSQMIADGVGGAKAVAEISAEAINVPQNEIQLTNGSGLGVDNRISPRAVTKMLMVIEHNLKSEPLGVTDLFPVAGRDARGTMRKRNIPSGAAVKTGTLSQVSALAGVLPTRDQGLVWFTVINNGSWNLQEFRDRQDALLQAMTEVWGVDPNATFATDSEYLGDPSRNIMQQTEEKT